MNTNGEALMREATALDQEVATAAIPPVPEVTAAAPGPAADQVAPAEPVVTPEQEAAALIDIILELSDPMYPTLKGIYTPEARERLARAAGPLMKKYNFSVSSLAKWKEEIDFTLVALPLILKTVQEIKIETAIRKVAKPAASPEPASPPAKPAPDLAPPLPEAVVFP